MPTNPQLMRRAAELIGKGATHKEAGAAVGRSERTIFKWLRDPTIREVVEKTRAATLDPTVEGVLREMLGATKRDGSPEQARGTAARVLLLHPEANETVDEGGPGAPIIHVYEPSP